MQIVSNRDNLHKMSNCFFLGEKEKKKKKNVINLSSAEYASRMAMVNGKDVGVMCFFKQALNPSG